MSDASSVPGAEPRRARSNQGFPFGNPDGSRADIADVLRDFVEFDAARYGMGVGMPESDLSWRVVAGPKGSGKTVYLRRMRAAALANNSLYVDDVQNDAPATERVFEFTQLWGQSVRTERWTRAWTCAIYRSLTTHILGVQALSEQLSRSQVDALLAFREELVPRPRARTSIYSQMMEILNAASTQHRGAQLLDDPAWAALETTLADILKSLPPVYFLIDSLDERYENAPSVWLQCQRGLFYATMALLRDSRLGGRLHVCVSVRDHVYSSVLRSEHADRYRGSPHIRLLQWNGQNLNSLLTEKANRLVDSACLVPGAALPMERWLGTSRMVDAHQTAFGIADYITGHTRMTPRDIVQVGNRLCEVVKDVKAQGLAPAAAVRTIKRAIQDHAREIGVDQLRVCANQILSDGAPPDSGRKEYLDAYLPNPSYDVGHEDTLRKVLRVVNRSRLRRSDLDRLNDLGRQEFGATTDLGQVLWQNHLLGMRVRDGRKKVDVYFSGSIGDWRLPDDEQIYVLHPIACAGAKLAGRQRGRRNDP